MISGLRLIAFSLIIAAAFGVFSIRFNTYTTNVPQSVTVNTFSQGYRVTLNGPGWIFGQPVEVDPASPAVLWATLLKTSGTTGIGLVAAQGCGVPIGPGDATLQGRGNSECPADFATVYDPARPGAVGTTPATTSSTALVPSVLVVDSPVSFTITQPSADSTNGNNNVIGISVENTAQAPPTPITITTAGAANTLGGASQFAIAVLEYSLYVETTGTASVCFQDDGQYERSPGDCGEQLFVYGHSTDSAGILSTSVCIFVGFIAIILFN